jgi:hypothetical protein
MTEELKTELTELQFKILDGMADDHEDIEQLYLYANRDFAAESEIGIDSPRWLIEVRFPLCELIDEIARMLREGYIEAKYSNDEALAPISTLNFSLLHYYWFGPTDKGQCAWKAYRAAL